MTYKGKCQGGPWDGEEREVERELALHPSLTGVYRWHEGAWAWKPAILRRPTPASECSDCPPAGYQTDETRCEPCPRRSTPAAEGG